MEAHKVAGMRSMVVGAILVVLSVVLFLNATGSAGINVDTLAIFFPLYVIFAAGVFVLLHGLFLHYPRAQVRVDHLISYGILLVTLAVTAYYIHQALINR